MTRACHESPPESPPKRPANDVPGLEACKRLAKAGWPQTCSHFFYSHQAWFDAPAWSLWDGASDLCPSWEPDEGDVEAPTIGEMLAYIRGRGWHYTLVACYPPSVLCLASVLMTGPTKSDQLLGQGLQESPADALANALSEAIEKEPK